MYTPPVDCATAPQATNDNKLASHRDKEIP